MKRSSTWTSGTNSTDLRLSGLSPSQTQRVRDLARATLADRGLEATVHSDHLDLLDGRTFGLDNLASQCHNGAEADWPKIVEAFLGGILEHCSDVPPELTADQIKAGAHLRLVHADQLASMGEDTKEVAYRYARELGGGLLEVLAHLEDGFVRWLRDCEVEQVGVDELRALGRERLWRIRPDVCEEFRRPDGRLYSIRGESSFVASKLLVLSELMQVQLPRRHREVPYGALVAVPTRHELIFAPVGRDVIPNLSGLMSLAPSFHRNGRAPFSPHVYWWREGQLEALTEFDRLGQYEVRSVDEFVEVVDHLLSRPDVA